MSEFVRICSASEMPANGKVSEFLVNGRAFCVAHVDGVMAVLDGVCPHEGGPLGEGSIEDGRVVCPWHAFAFDVRTGIASEDSDLKADVFESRLQGGELQARL